MSIRAYELNESNFVVVVDSVTMLPVAIAINEFQDLDAADKFLDWSEGLRGLKLHDAVELEHAIERWRQAGEPEGGGL